MWHSGLPSLSMLRGGVGAGERTPLIVNRRGITGYSRLWFECIPPGSELSTGSLISLLLLPLWGSLPSADKTRHLTLTNVGGGKGVSKLR